MAAVTAPPGRSLLGKVTLRPAVRFLSRMARPARAPLANLASMPMHVAALGCLDAAPFQRSWHVAVGLVVICASLMWLEHVIADER